MTYNPKEIPEQVNVTPVHPLVNFAYLVGTVGVASIIIYSVLGWVAAQLVTRISPELEVKIGQQLLSTVETVQGETHQQQLGYLEELLLSLHAPHSKTRVPVTLHIIDGEVANAFIIPGGHILVTTALLEQAESENELAFVLAHELGHFVARDPLKGLGRSLVLLTVTSTLGLGAGDVPGMVTLSGQLTDLHYSRKQESAADVYALTALVRRYGHGDRSLSFFERLKTKDKRGKLSAYFSTHPLTRERIDYLRKVAAKRGWSMTGEVTDLPETFE